MLIQLLDLLPHPEGGYYRQVFRSSQVVRPGDSPTQLASITTIYFLLVAGQYSRWHRITSDEVWHYYEGDPLELIWLHPVGTVDQRHVLGPTGEERRPVPVVPRGCWQAARPLGDYTLVGCSVARGFEVADFRLLVDDPEEQARPRARFPDLATLI